MAKFVRLDLDPGLAVDAYEVSLGAFLELAHQHRVPVTALRAFYVDGFVFKHRARLRGAAGPLVIELLSPAPAPTGSRPGSQHSSQYRSCSGRQSFAKR